jgi:Kef-type K+ transport system membrane component KefB
MFFLIRIDFSGDDHLMAESMMALGFTLVVAYLAGKMIERLRFPKITGYLIAGVLTGPYFLDLLSVEVVKNLQLIDNIALCLIALTAGGEFRYSSIRKHLSTIMSTIAGQISVVMILLLIFTILYSYSITFLQGEQLAIIIGAGLLLGTLSIATSPATTIAVITETHAKGPFSDFILGVTVFKDVIVVLVFSVVISFAEPLILQLNQVEFSHVLTVLMEIGISIVLGIAAGAIILAYLKYIGEQKVLFLLGFIIFVIELSQIIHLEMILLFMVAGFFVQNFSRSGAPLIQAIEEVSLPIFVTFFAITGASLNIQIFIQNWTLALLIVVLRLYGTYQGTVWAAKLTSSDKNIQKYGWMGFIGQAGLTLGLASLTLRTIPGPIGIGISTIIISSITINQIIGPVLFRLALQKVGEIRTSTRDLVQKIS